MASDRSRRRSKLSVAMAKLLAVASSFSAVFAIVLPSLSSNLFSSSPLHWTFIGAQRGRAAVSPVVVAPAPVGPAPRSSDAASVAAGVVAIAVVSLAATTGRLGRRRVMPRAKVHVALNAAFSAPIAPPMALAARMAEDPSCLRNEGVRPVVIQAALGQPTVDERLSLSEAVFASSDATPSSSARAKRSSNKQRYNERKFRRQMGSRLLRRASTTMAPVASPYTAFDPSKIRSKLQMSLRMKAGHSSSRRREPTSPDSGAHGQSHITESVSQLFVTIGMNNRHQK